MGNWGCSGGAKKEYEQKTADLKWNQLEQYEWQGKLLDADLRLLEERGTELACIVKTGVRV